MWIEDINPPSAEPLTLDYTKTFLRVDTDAEDALIRDFITSARQQIESLIGSSLITRRRIYRSDKVRSAGIFINHRPIIEVHSVALRRDDGELITIDSDSLVINTRCVPVAIRPKSSQAWSHDPSVIHIEVELDAGYGTEPSDIPMPIRQALLLLIADAYEHRHMDTDRTRPAFPMMVDALLMPYRGPRL